MRLHEIKHEFDEGKFERDCAFYLRQMGDDAHDLRLYRGMAAGATMGAVRPFRVRTGSVSMPARTHAALNAAFDEKFGHPFRNGLFATGGRGTASSYGEGGPKVIVPVGEFDWLCYPDIHDLYGEYYEMKEEYGEDRAHAMIMDSVKRDHSLHNKNLPACVASKAEVMLWCPGGYYVFDPEEHLPAAIA